MNENKDYPGEKWQTVVFDFEFVNDLKLEISNYGRVKSTNKIFKDHILKGSMINGYRIVRLKFYEPRTKKMEQYFAQMQKQITAQSKKNTAERLLLRVEKNKDELYHKRKRDLQDSIKLVKDIKKSLSKKYLADLKGRVINYHSLVHRWVAEYFLKKPSEAHTVVAHLDYNKLNNRSNNLKWMTPEENYAHQQNSPYVIEEKSTRLNRRTTNSKVSKLTITKVMLLKKLLNQGKPMRTLVKQFKITDTQILRIKRGENWGDIEAAT